MAIWYIDNVSGDNANGGTSPADAKSTIDAFSNFPSLANGDIIRIKATGVDYNLITTGAGATANKPLFSVNGTAQTLCFITNYVTDTTNPVISATKDSGVTGYWRFNSFLTKNINFIIDEANAATNINAIITLSTTASDRHKFDNCGFDLRRTGGTYTTPESVSLFNNAGLYTNCIFKLNDGAFNLSLANATLQKCKILDYLINSLGTNALVIGAIFKTIITASYSSTVASRNGSLFNWSNYQICFNTIIIKDDNQAKDFSFFYSLTVTFWKTSQPNFFSNIIISQRSLGTTTILGAAGGGGQTPLANETVALGNNALLNMNFSYNFNYTNISEDDFQFYGPNIALSASPFLSLDPNNSNFCVLDTSNANGLACTNASFIDPNLDLGAKETVGSGGATPNAYDLRAGVTVGSVTGTLIVPDPSKVLIGEIYDATPNQKTGTLESTDPGISNVVSGISYKINSVNYTGTRTSIYALLPANKVQFNYDRGDGTFGTDKGELFNTVLTADKIKVNEVILNLNNEITGTYNASELYTDLDLTKVVDDYSFRYNSLTDNRTGTRTAKYALLPANNVESGVDRGDGQLGTNKGENFNTALTANQIKVDEVIQNLGNTITGNYVATERYTLLPENEVKLGTSFIYNNVNYTGTFSGATDYPIESKVLYPTTYAFGTKQGTLAKYNEDNLDIATQIRDNAKIIIQNILPTWQELKYLKDVEKNDFYSNAEKFGIRALNDERTFDIIGKETIDLDFEIKLTTDFVNQDGDDIERQKEDYLIAKMEEVRRQLRISKFGMFNNIRNVKEWRRAEVEKVNNNNVLVCISIITVSYSVK